MLRVGHYLNQFFAGVGAEARASHAPERRDGAVGPGRLLQGLLGDDGRLVSTLVCGDNFFNERAGEAHAAEQTSTARAVTDFKARMTPSLPRRWRAISPRGS